VRIVVTAGIAVAFLLSVAAAVETIQGATNSPGSCITPEQGLMRVVSAKLKRGSSLDEGMYICYKMGLREVYFSCGPARAEALLGPRVKFNAKDITCTVEIIVPRSSPFSTPEKDTCLVLCYAADGAFEGCLKADCYNLCNTLIYKGLVVGHAQPGDRKAPWQAMVAEGF
jgi:hypothetical protein